MDVLPTRTWNGLTIPAAGTYALDQNHKRLGFLAMHMMVSPVRGEFAEGEATVVVADDPLASQVSCTIRAESIDTHVPDRDTHLKSPDFLDVENHPTIEFRSTGLRMQAEVDPIFSWARLKAGTGGRLPHDPQADGAFTRFLMDGLLTVRGVTRPVTLECEFGGVGHDPYGQDIFGFHGSCEIEREDWGLLWNVALEAGGVLVAKKVRIEIAGEMIRQA
ncbi:YceI family protein [Promicromonospora thailandica]|uniref:Polyisoprenoid-binding protein YceI n=1 Tax=Promicromonospora thailandica TaxID=765201 RepID=A0A9X2GD75_9MICO|nr:YceI family protein [Promicromonospora thailandica]MCP2266421.1 Polyisoprenoid-binding protein YceI [Promicromonospora thailandica]BFF20102.1 YceI family protein [Promicromonospora thailandica]